MRSTLCCLCFAAYVGSPLPTFRDNVSVLFFSRVKQNRRSEHLKLQHVWRIKYGTLQPYTELQSAKFPSFCHVATSSHNIHQSCRKVAWNRSNRFKSRYFVRKVIWHIKSIKQGRQCAYNVMLWRLRWIMLVWKIKSEFHLYCWRTYCRCQQRNKYWKFSRGSTTMSSHYCCATYVSANNKKYN